MNQSATAAAVPVDNRPVPVADEMNAPFWSHAAAGRFVLARCAECRTWLAPPVSNCLSCLGRQIEWEPASGRGTVYSYIEYRRAWSADWAAQVPYLVGVVELAEGPRMITGLRYDRTGTAPAVDSPVVVHFEPRAGGAMVPVFGAGQ